MALALHLVTLGVADVEASAAFYERLGLLRSTQSVPGSVAFFQVGPMVLSVFGRADLAADAQVADSRPGFSGVTLANNVESPEAVIALVETAVAAGARLVRAPEKAFWGGFTAYFADPDGHLWEVAHNPHWRFDESGMVRLPD
ncbi:VOC family protein [Prosthecomicrobium sp. N25]|uniref:VOC family protein n=1 Tax=Prosthecomicrobium sp. N25 TaxID=3129254 RepID=UPI0030782A0B